MLYRICILASAPSKKIIKETKALDAGPKLSGGVTIGTESPEEAQRDHFNSKPDGGREKL